MTREEFFEAFLKYPYSPIKIGDLRKCIETYPDNIIPFKIVDMWSWRGIYQDACLEVELKDCGKHDLLIELTDLTNNEFTGWKGGEYEYDDYDYVHFENDPGASTTHKDNSVSLHLFKDNQNNPFIEHVLKYFENDRCVDEPITDMTNNVLKSQDIIITWRNGQMVKGAVRDVDTGKITVIFEDGCVEDVDPKNTFLNRNIKYKNRTT